MAELDPDAAAALGEALANALGSELSRPIACRDVSAEHREWDFEALDAVTAEVVRFVSHVRCVPERMMKAMAEVTDDIWAVLQEELAALGVRDCIVSFGSRDLPKSKRERKTLARLVARRIHE